MTALNLRRFTVTEVDRMIDVGLLDADEKLELLEGALELMSPQSADHAWLIDYLAQELREAYGSEQHVREQKPILAADDSRPEPDIAVLRQPLSAYRGRLPTGADLLLVVEISLSSLERDHRKAAIYARAGVPVYWILDVDGRRLEVHTEPGPDGYGVVTLLAPTRSVQPPDREIRWEIASLLP